VSVACLDLPAFPLQILWRREPTWRAHPTVVIDEDHPQGFVRWACERARGLGILVGQRYAHALALCGDLRARTISDALIDEVTRELRAALHQLSPRVEPGEPGTFWLDGEGLERIFIGATTWPHAIAKVATDHDFTGAVVVGFSRFATFAIARATRTGITISRTEADERQLAARVPLARLDIEPKLRDSLARLGVTTIGQMIRLPGGGILERFGRAAHHLYQLAAGEKWDPIVPVAPPTTPDERLQFDDDETRIDALVQALTVAIDRLLDRLARAGRAVVTLHVELVIRHTLGKLEPRVEDLISAHPTLDRRQLVRLLHLRLTAAAPLGPVHTARVWASDVSASREQLALFASRPRRDLRAADEALAKLRAELGNDAVVRAVLREGHLPEAKFAFERFDRMRPARPRDTGPVIQLIRRIRTRPLVLPPQVRQVRDDGWLLANLAQGPVVRLIGPYVISGGWWQNPEAMPVHREYHYAELRRGDTLWVYYDRVRRRWFQHGAIE